MKVEIIAKDTIKPSSPTPDNLRSSKLCLFDQFSPPFYGSLLLFYSFNHVSVTEQSHRLKKSLSVTLTRFFPLAGRIKDNMTIDCNDHGVVYVKARVNCPLSEFLEQPKAEALQQFIPINLGSTEGGTDFLLLVQSTFFDCGGVAIGVSISHKYADASTLTTFIKGWATTTLGSGEAVAPVYNASSLFPPRNSIAIQPLSLNFEKEKFVMKRLVFDAPKIAALKSIAASASVQLPTRVEVVTALIWKCAMKASRSNSGFSKLSLLSQSVNLRRRTVPPLPDNSIGNLVSHFSARKDESEIELQGLVRELRKGIQDFSQNYMKKLQNDPFEAIMESFQQVRNVFTIHEAEFYVCTSLCNFSVYDIDFGWGKPAWVTVPCGPLKNLVNLIDKRGGDGSIEAWVILSEEDMTLFQSDKELLAYASLNPSVLSPAAKLKLISSL